MLLEHYMQFPFFTAAQMIYNYIKTKQVTNSPSSQSSPPPGFTIGYVLTLSWLVVYLTYKYEAVSALVAIPGIVGFIHLASQHI